MVHQERNLKINYRKRLMWCIDLRDPKYLIDRGLNALNKIESPSYEKLITLPVRDIKPRYKFDANCTLRENSDREKFRSKNLKNRDFEH